MNRLRTFFLLALTLTQAHAAEPIIDIYVSTGDNHYLGSSLPIDSPASIDATFDLFENINQARRVYWRGLEASCWLETIQAHPENPRYFSFWQWLNELYKTVSPDTLAVKAAHARGMEIWGMGSLWDWGSPPDTPGFNDYPFTFESKLKLAHPEWAPVDKHGVRHQGGPIELAYPEARKALIDIIVKETLKAGYDGISFLTYVENYSLRFADEFGFSDPIVADFKAQYKLDLRTEAFRRGASREDWLRLRGSYITSFLRELRSALDLHQIKLGMVVNSNDPRQPQSWNVPELMTTAGSHFMDVDTWVREGLVDELLIWGNNSGQSQLKALDDLQFLARGTKTSVSVITSGPFRENWKPYQDKGMATIIAVSDDAQHLDRGFVPEQSEAELASDDLWKRMRAMAGIIAKAPAMREAQKKVGGLANTVDVGRTKRLVELCQSPHLIERRLALEALGKLGTHSPLVDTAIIRGLNDEENGVRCIAALAASNLQSPTLCDALFEATAKHGNHMLRECSIIALRRLTPLPTEILRDAALHAKSAQVREVAMRALIPHATVAMLPTFREALQNKPTVPSNPASDRDAESARFVRFAATEALGNIARSHEVIDLLKNTLDDKDRAIASRAAVSLGTLARVKDPKTDPQKPGMLASLLHAFTTAPDDGWSFRPIGNAILEFGEIGRSSLFQIEYGSSNSKLAELAWRVVDLTQRTGTFSSVSEEQNEAAHARRPGSKTSTHDLHVDPSKGSDSNDGRSAPTKTIARAIKLAQPGDTIHLTPGTYYESADLSHKHGLPGQPITLDGHGAVLDGSEPLKAAEWESLGHDLYRKVKLMAHMDDAIKCRWFFLWNGQMNRMGLCSKGPSLPLKKPDELQANEWTYVQAEDAFYLRLTAGQSLDAANIRYPLRSSAVVESGKGSWLVVKNITGTHVYNDGYNIHGEQRHQVFQNIAAIDCGDDGFSAHEDGECDIDGFTSIGNATGLCDTVSSLTNYKNVFIKDCHGFDIFFIGDSPHRMENVLVESSAARTLEVSCHDYRGQALPSTAVLKNVLIRRMAGSPGEARISRNAKLTLDHCTFEGLNVTVTPGGEVQVLRSIFKGNPKPDLLLFNDTLWQGTGNLYDLASFRVHQTSYTPKTFADYQKLTGTEIDSKWEALTSQPKEAGADDVELRKLKR